MTSYHVSFIIQISHLFRYSTTVEIFNCTEQNHIGGIWAGRVSLDTRYLVS